MTSELQSDGYSLDQECHVDLEYLAGFGISPRKTDKQRTSCKRCEIKFLTAFHNFGQLPRGNKRSDALLLSFSRTTDTYIFH